MSNFSVKEVMLEILEAINSALWSYPLIILIVGSGIYYSVRMRFPQFRYIKEMFRIMASGSESEKGMSPLVAFIFTAARTVGVGNIAGMAAALSFGGPGAIFWLWVLALFGSAVAMVEGSLAQEFNVCIDGELRGGPAYYMERGVKNKRLGRALGLAYAAITMVSMPVFCTTVQSYNIAHGFSDAFGVPAVAAGAALTLLLGLVVFGGLKRIGNAAKRISPLMAVVYLIMTAVVMVFHFDRVPEAFALIVHSAFGADAAFGGILGATITWGMKRGVFANEVGIGTSAITGAIGDVDHPVEQGLLNALSVFIGTFFVCTPSAIMMLVTGCYNVVSPEGVLLYEGLPGVEYGNGFVMAAIDTVVPGLGAPFVAVAVFSFSFVALLAYNVYGESNALYIVKDVRVTVVVKVVMLAAVFIGSVVSADAVWTIGDIGNAAMAWINVVALLLAGPMCIRLLKDYEQEAVRVTDDKGAALAPPCDPSVLG